MLAQDFTGEIARLAHHLCGAEVVPNGARKTIADAVDGLRCAKAPHELLTVAGDLAAAIHRWELALCLGNAVNHQAARARVGELSLRWTELVGQRPD